MQLGITARNASKEHIRYCKLLAQSNPETCKYEYFDEQKSASASIAYGFFTAD